MKLLVDEGRGRLRPLPASLYAITVGAVAALLIVLGHVQWLVAIAAALGLAEGTLRVVLAIFDRRDRRA
jgi:ATP phosphoribosyltransferase regulatory subunit HisZ